MERYNEFISSVEKQRPKFIDLNGALTEIVMKTPPDAFILNSNGSSTNIKVEFETNTDQFVVRCLVPKCLLTGDIDVGKFHLSLIINESLSVVAKRVDLDTCQLVTFQRPEQGEYFRDIDDTLVELRLIVVK